LRNQASINDHNQRLNEQRAKALDLVKGALQLEAKANKLNAQEREIYLNRKEVQGLMNDLERAYQWQSLQLEKQLAKVEQAMENLALGRKANYLMSEEERLQLYHQRLNNLSTHINEMYQVKQAWLKIEAKENELSNREQRLELEKVYNRTTTQISKLAVKKQEVTNYWDRKALNHKVQIMNAIGKAW